MSKKMIYVISIFFMLGLFTGAANAAEAFLQGGGDDGILSIEAIHYDANLPGAPYTRPPEYEDANVYIHHWDPVILEFDLRSDPNYVEPNIITGPSMQGLPDVGASFKSDKDADYYFYEDSARMDYRVKFVKSGPHYVWVRGYTNGYVGWGVSNSFFIGLDNKETSAEVMEIDKRFVYAWEDEFQRDIGTDPGIYNIVAGVHTINIWMREDGLLIEKIVFTTNPDYDPNEIDDGNGPPESPRVGLEQASGPNPYDMEQNTQKKYTHLSWLPGDYAPTVNGHRIYFSTVFSDVNEGKVGAKIVDKQSKTHYPTNYSWLNLDWETTYYWRVDEYNTPDADWDAGNVWQFTVEPNCWELTSDHIIDATASCSSEPNQDPNKTIDGSGLNANDEHSTDANDMWLSATGCCPPGWIEYELDKPYKLNAMWIWNYNETGHTNYGLNQVEITYSIDGINYFLLGNYSLTQATGLANYTHGDEINFHEKVAKFVRINITSNHGGAGHCGLSEVRFFYVPLSATRPQPLDASTEIDPRSLVLSWRRGREAAQHKVYISDDQQKVIDNDPTVLAATVNGPNNTSYDTSPLGLDIGKTYYWKINEVNAAKAPYDTWESDVWQFSTVDYFVVDNMNDYNDTAPYRIYYVWRDGWDIDVTMQGNDTGSQIGHKNLTDNGISESTRVHGGAGLSMPYYYENDGGTVKKPRGGSTSNPDNPLSYYSEATAKTTGQNSLNFITDWTKNGAVELSLWFYGYPFNATGAYERMYVALEDGNAHYKAVYYDTANGYDPEEVKSPRWHEWNIQLSDFTGVTLTNVQKVHIGFGDRTNINSHAGTSCGTAGPWFIVRFDDIRLYPARCVASLRQPEADLDNDCDVDYDDLAVMTDDWLVEDANKTGELILHWAFDETSGTVAIDSSGKGHNGDINDATINLTGQVGKCYYFDGGDNGVGDNVIVQDVNDTNSYMDDLYGLSVCMWIKNFVDTTTANDRGFIVFDAMGDFPSQGDKRNMRYDAVGSGSGETKVIVCGVTATGGFQQVESPSGRQRSNSWQHVAMTWGSGQPVKLYIGGVYYYPYTTQSPPLGSTTGYNSIIVGKGKEDNLDKEGWYGNIDDVQIYNYELTQAEVQTVMTGATIANKSNIYYPTPSPAELYDGEAEGSRSINFRDLAFIATNKWLEAPMLWP